MTTSRPCNSPKQAVHMGIYKDMHIHPYVSQPSQWLKRWKIQLWDPARRPLWSFEGVHIVCNTLLI